MVVIQAMVCHSMCLFVVVVVGWLGGGARRSVKEKEGEGERAKGRAKGKEWRRGRKGERQGDRHVGRLGGRVGGREGGRQEGGRMGGRVGVAVAGGRAGRKGLPSSHDGRQTPRVSGCTGTMSMRLSLHRQVHLRDRLHVVLDKLW